MLPSGSSLRYAVQFSGWGIPDAPHIEEHPELRPHEWRMPTERMRMDIPDWLRGRGGVVVYRGVKDRNWLQLVPRSLRLEHMPGWHAPFPQLPHPFKRDDTLVPVDWVRLDRSLHGDDTVAAIRTMRRDFCRIWVGDTRRYDVIHERDIWNPDPKVNLPTIDGKEFDIG